MSDKLTVHERLAFAVLGRILEERGSIERDSLRVIVGSRGSELGRDFIRFKDLALVQEEDVRPSFFKRIIGTRPRRMVRLTEQGSAIMRALAAEVAAPDEGIVQPVATVIDIAMPASSEAVDQLTDQTTTNDEKDSANYPSENVDKPAANAAIVLLASTTVKERSKPKRFAPTDYTDTLGGQPEDSSLELPTSARLDGVSETLGLLGIELTAAGKLLAASRWADGYTDGEVILEVLLVAMAHAARLHQSGTASIDNDAMNDLIEAIEVSLRQIANDTGIAPKQLSECIESVRLFLARDENANVLLSAFLSDALRGMAPPAILPENVWIPPETDEE